MPVNSFDNYPMAWKPEKSQLPRPIYKSLAEQMEKDISEGLLLPGTKLPPQRELADYLDINFTTVTRAYKLCEYKGLIQSVMGSGTFVAAHANQRAPLAKSIFRHNVIEMGPISSFEETNDLVVPLLRKVLDHLYPEQFLTYREPAGMAHQRQAGAEWLSLLGVKVKYTDVLIMTGAQNALTTALLTLFNPGDRIAVDAFTYMNFIELSKLYHLTLVPVTGDENGMSAVELDNVCNQSHVSGVFLIPSCHNPTTIVMSEERKKDIAKVIKKHELLLVEDDADAFMTYGYVEDCGEPLYSMLPDNTVYICSMSKSLCSGLRVALMVVPPNMETAFQRSIFNTNVKTSSMDAEVISEAIISGAAHKIVEHRIQLAKEANAIFNEIAYGEKPSKRAQKTNKKKPSNRKAPVKSSNIKFDDAIPKLPDGRHPFPYYRWLAIDTDETPEAVQARLLDKGVSVFPSSNFRADSKATEKFLRVSLSSSGSMENLRKGLEIIKSEISVV